MTIRFRFSPGVVFEPERGTDRGGYGVIPEGKNRETERGDKMEFKRGNICGVVVYLLMIMLMIFPVGCINDEPDDSRSLIPGDLLPEFTVTTLAGQVIDNDSFLGKTGYIIFFSTKCSDCRRELPRMEASFREMQKKGLAGQSEVICISRDDDMAEVARFWEEYGLTMPVAVDSGKEIYHKFASSGVPRLYIVKDNVIVSTFLEEIPTNIFE